mmetsp:Transcript_8924/g.25532  ORF Transcript_8924/g.25532 Transcript_8924/m.25532 type:complete len:535 (-) Transcript_8924:1-1605(-)
MAMTCDTTKLSNPCPPDELCRAFKNHPEFERQVDMKTKMGDDGICTCQYYPGIPSTLCPGNQFATSAVFVTFFCLELWAIIFPIPVFICLTRTLWDVVQEGRFKLSNGICQVLLLAIFQQFSVSTFSLLLLLGSFDLDVHALAYNYIIPVLQLFFGTTSCLVVLMVVWSWTRLIARTRRVRQKTLSSIRLGLAVFGTFFFTYMLVTWAILFDTALVTTGLAATLGVELVICLFTAHGLRRAFSFELNPEVAPMATTNVVGLPPTPSSGPSPQYSFASRLPSPLVHKSSQGETPRTSPSPQVKAPPTPQRSLRAASSSDDLGAAVILPFVVAVYETSVSLCVGCCFAITGLIMFGFYDSKNNILFVVGACIFVHMALWFGLAVNDWVRFVMIEDARSSKWLFCIRWRFIFRLMERQSPPQAPGADTNGEKRGCPWPQLLSPPVFSPFASSCFTPAVPDDDPCFNVDGVPSFTSLGDVEVVEENPSVRLRVSDRASDPRESRPESELSVQSAGLVPVVSVQESKDIESACSCDCDS